MTVSRVNPFAAPPDVEEKSNRPQIDHDSPRHSSRPENPVNGPEPSTSVRMHPNAPRANLQANSARAGSGRRISGSSTRENTGTAWNTGLAVACDLVQASISSWRDAGRAVDLPMREFEEMIEPLATQALMQAPAPADFLAATIERLRTDGSPSQDADLLQKLEHLKAGMEDANALGFYAVMAVMVAAAGIADSIRDNGVNVASKVIGQVQAFAKHVSALLNAASPAESSQTAKLIAMARAAMKVPFEYMPGRGMPPSLSHSMMAWNRAACSVKTKASQEQLEAALRSFLDARLGKRE